MISTLPPFLIFIIGAILFAFTKGKLRSALLIIVPLVGLFNLLNIPIGTHWTVKFLDFELVFGEVDRLSRVFGIIFHVIAVITSIYILNFDNTIEYVSGFIYAGSALGVVFAGDLFSLFVFWEMLTVGSMFLILANKTDKSTQAAFRYTLFHVVGGLILLAGIILHYKETGSITFTKFGLSTTGSYLIFLGFGINCAWPLVHTWLSDAYPNATIGGVIFLSAFTTKTAVYVLARSFPGTEALIWLGTGMAAFPIFYAVIENDLRRVLAYSLINQVGFMCVGIGIGTELAINGAVAHAFNDILFKGLLFMSVGAVMYRTGKINATDLGGLYKSMPLTCLFCVVGAASISAFPLFSGFVSKSMVMSAALDGHYNFVWFVLLFAAAGVFHHAGIKIPFFTFFSHDAGHRVKEAPLNMLIAMGIAAFLCIFIGSFPQYMYSLLPFDTNYQPYTYDHVMGQTQLLFYSALAFTLLLLSGIYPAEMRAINVDADWTYRRGGRLFYDLSDKFFNRLNGLVHRLIGIAMTDTIIEAGHTAIYRTVNLIYIPVLKIKGLDSSAIESRAKNLENYINLSSLPIGIAAIIPVIFIVLLFLI